MIVRVNTTPYEYKIIDVELSKIANVERKLPSNYINKNFSLYQDEEGKPIYFELDCNVFYT